MATTSASFGPDTTVVLITGANGGIGFDTAVRLATDPTHKYHVVLAVRSLEKGRAAVASIEARVAAASLPAPSLSLVQLDVTDAATATAAAASLAAAGVPRIDVLLNNAGIVTNAGIPSPDPAGLQTELRATLETNTVGPAVVTAALLPLLKKSANPRLIYVSSGLGSLGYFADPTLPFSMVMALEYRVSKAALDMLALYHHREFAAWGCKVWALCPGYVVTNLTGEADRENRVRNGALSSETSAQTIADVIEGKRDADVGKFVHKDGIYPW